MNTTTIDQLDRISVVEVSGADAETIMHNLTTNEVKSLKDGQGRESFITDVRGKTLGHVCLFREGANLLLIGASGQSEVIRSHIDRYTIREDATPAIRDSEHTAWVLSPAAANLAGLDLMDGITLKSAPIVIEGTEAKCYATRWLGEGTVVILGRPGVAASLAEGLQTRLLDAGSGEIELGGERTFHDSRTRIGFPWLGIDLDDSNLPQEADRDEVAISFNKGCYLGQETVARLDALGQVQKKLVRWSILGGVPAAGTTLESEGKKVARLTSVVPDGSGGALAIGFARRSHFETGSTAEGKITHEENNEGATSIKGTVL